MKEAGILAAAKQHAQELAGPSSPEIGTGFFSTAVVDILGSLPWCAFSNAGCRGACPDVERGNDLSMSSVLLPLECRRLRGTVCLCLLLPS